MKKYALIFGGTGGIGTHLIEQFANAGWETLFTYKEDYEEARTLEASNEGAIAYRVNAADETDIKRLVDEVKSHYGKLNALIYAAGIFEDALMDKMELSSWNRVMAVNLTGAFLATKHMLPLLRESGNGRILYIGSVMGEAGCYGSGSYSVTKAGLIALAKSVALENARKNVTANVLSFGYIDTGMTARVPDNVLESAMKNIPMKRLGDASDAARVVVDFCQEHMNYISGQVIRVNGALYV